MSSFEFDREAKNIEPGRLEVAKKAFLSVPKAFTIRQGHVVGEEQFDTRLRRAIAAYKAGHF